MSEEKKPEKRKNRRIYRKDPWNRLNVKLELFIAPDLKMRIEALPRPSAQPREESEES